MSTRPEIIFVAGVDLSGSTVVDLALGSLPGIVGLGEVDNILVPAKRSLGEAKNGPIGDQLCTCGKLGKECPIWGPVLNYLQSHTASPYSIRYRFLLDQVAKTLTGVSYVVDSSKESVALERVISAANDIPLQGPPKVVLVRRGPVSWLLSDDRRAKRRNLSRNLRIRRRRLRKWATRYRGLDKSITRLSLPTMRVGLSQLQADPDTLIYALRSGLGISLKPGESIDIGKTQSHVLWGSHHRHGGSTSQAIRPQPKEPLSAQFEGMAILASVPVALSQHIKLVLLETLRQRPHG